MKMQMPTPYSQNFKEMPLLLKLLFLSYAYSVIISLISLLQQNPFSFQYLNTGFHQNYPSIWDMYYLLLGIVSIIVYMKRSYSLLKKYLFSTAIILVLGLVNSLNSDSGLTQEVRGIVTFVYILIYALGGVLIKYQLSQKKYFNKP